MKILMTKSFYRWFKKHNIFYSVLSNSINELNNGLFDANLGGNLFKKRIPIIGKGKRKSARTIICYKKEQRAIFFDGFKKNEKDNLELDELKALKELCRIMSSLTDNDIKQAIAKKVLLEVKNER